MTKPQTKVPCGWAATRKGTSLSLERLVFATLLLGAAASNHLKRLPSEPGSHDLLAIALAGLVVGSIAWHRGFFHKIIKTEPAQAET